MVSCSADRPGIGETNEESLLGKLYRRPNSWHDGQEEEHPKHVRHCSRRSRQINSDGFVSVQGRNHRSTEGR